MAPPSATDYGSIPETSELGTKKAASNILSIESLIRHPSNMKQAGQYMDRPGLISLGTGLPSSEYFPINQMEIKVPSMHKAEDPELSLSFAKRGGHGEYDLSIALNYCGGSGQAELVRFVTKHTEIVSNPPYFDWQCALSIGTTSVTEQAFRMFCERGDYILCEEYTFSSAVDTADPLGIKVAGIAMDQEGLLPQSLDEILSNWDVQIRGARKPHLLYTIPSGQNPTGATQSAQRRRDVYKIAQKHDIYILEDEPYYFLQMQPYSKNDTASIPQNSEEFLQALVPTLLSMDVDGRVMRADSFSKVVGPGLRTGWITASEQIIERFVRHNDFSTQNPSGISQIILYKILEEGWGHEGYFKWLINLRLQYTNRRNVILAACEKNLPASVVSWTPPSAGMFLWLKVDWRRHPLAEIKSLLDLEHEIFLDAVQQGVLISKGSWFLAERGVAAENMFFRLTYASASSGEIEKAIEYLGLAIRRCFSLIQ
ncbi:pyridoxal phosphate-dependent transferase [Bisporella sp. PMI_857]|nr:pyridoxal phosphate-dependent transferase [Bisporella sp. PMI_857]